MIIQVFNIVVPPVEGQLGHIYDFLSLCLHVYLHLPTSKIFSAVWLYLVQL
jgi:hypothetical protein